MALPGMSFEIVQSAGPVLGLRADRTAVIAMTERGPQEIPVLVHSYEEFVREFGLPVDGTLGSLLAASYFECGGEELMVARFVPAGAKRAASTLAVVGLGSGAAMGLQARDPGEFGNAISVSGILHVRKRGRASRVTGAGNGDKLSIGPLSAPLFVAHGSRAAEVDVGLPVRIIGQFTGGQREAWARVTAAADTLDGDGRQQITLSTTVPAAADSADSASILVEVYERSFGLCVHERGRSDIIVDGLDLARPDDLKAALAPTTVSISSVPTVGAGVVGLPAPGVSAQLAGGALGLEDSSNTLALRQSFERALAALELSELPDIVVAPDLWSRIFRTKGVKRLAFSPSEAIELSDAMVKSAARTADRVVLVDPPLVERGSDIRPMTASELEVWRKARETALPEGARDFAAAYAPWARIVAGVRYRGDDTMLVPPSLFVAGRMAQTTRDRGPWNATGNVSLENVVGLESSLSFSDQQRLQDVGINPLGMELPRGATIQGVRSLSWPDRKAWRFLSTRRLFNYLRRALRPIGLSYVFEPSSPATWILLRRDLERFLRDLFRAGALAGSVPEQAFFVKIDEELNPEDQRAAGVLVAQIGVAPAYPLEFLVVRLVVANSTTQVTEDPIVS